tara:strand:+ start:1761 stop:2387 length:627 start_codon:yes stop_codon:yes gene_type:complete
MSKKYRIICRNYIPTNTLYGFKGDNRSFSISKDASHRTGLIFDVDMEDLSVYNLTTTTSGTIPVNCTTKLIREISRPFRWFQGKSVYNSNIIVDEFKQEVKLNKILSIYICFKGNDPAVIGSPDIKTYLDLDLYIEDNELNIKGFVFGNRYPSNELFITDSCNCQLLSNFNAEDGFISPIWNLVMNKKVLMNTINKNININKITSKFN